MSQPDEEHDQDSEPTMTAPPEERPTGEHRSEEPPQEPGDRSAEEDLAEG